MEKDKTPLVSMVSVFYNRAYCLDKSVSSMLDQTYPNMEIILIDDGSTDNTLEELNKFKSYPRVKVISHENLGFTNSIKKAVEEVSSGELIAVHGSGDVSFPNRILKQVEFLNSNLDVGIVGCGCEIFSEKTNESHFAIRPFKLEKGQFLQRGTNMFSHGEVMMRKENYTLAGGYRPHFNLAQDFDLWLRINETTGVARFSEILYLEFGRADGVRNDPVKAIKQKKFSHLAMLSSYSRQKGDDILNQVTEGEDVFDLLEGSVSLSDRFSRLALREMGSRDMVLSEAYIREAAHYNNSLKVKFINYIRTTTFLLALLRGVRKIRLDFRNRKSKKNMNN